MKRENIQRLDASLEISFYRTTLILYGVITLLFSGIFYLQFHETLGIFSVALTLVVMVPFVGFYLWRVIQIYRRADQYFFCKCTLGSPHQRLWTKGMMYFTVVIEDPEGGRFAADTHAIFASYGMMEPLMESYVNKTVTIGYNRETEMVVVIG